jgi:sensor histidine kinase YesM
MRYILTFLYWLLVWIFYDLFFGYGKLYNLYSLSFSLIIVLITAGSAYFLNYFLLPKYLFTRRYGRFILFAFYTLIMALWLEVVTVVIFFIWVQKFTILLLDGSSRDIYSLIAGTSFIVLLSVSIRLAEYSFEAQNRKQAALREKVESELKMLKSQIHPHFLFNTLNNIYALAVNKSDATPDAVLKLSGLLDYLIYHGNEDEVELKKELELIKNYIELEKFRYGKRLTIHQSTIGECENIKIPPVLLLPFVENAFKHGISKSRGDVWLRIDIEINTEELTFRIENSKPRQPESQISKDGIGLDNLRRRLNLQYKDRHDLNIVDGEDSYIVELRLQHNL